MKQTKAKSMPRRIISAFLAFAMMITTCGLLVPQMALTVYADSDKTISGLGTGAIGKPARGDTNRENRWTGDYVYFGTYDNSPVKYRVLDPLSTDFNSDTDNSAGRKTMLLDCDSMLVAMQHVVGDNMPAAPYGADGWMNSDIKTWLNGDFYNDSFTAQERAAIAASNKSDYSLTDGPGLVSQQNRMDYQPLTGEFVFLLDAKEATNKYYGYYPDHRKSNARIKSGIVSLGDYNYTMWWLRSPCYEIDNNDLRGKSLK